MDKLRQIRNQIEELESLLQIKKGSSFVFELDFVDLSKHSADQIMEAIKKLKEKYQKNSGYALNAGPVKL